MSSHHTHGQLLKHYRMEENAKSKREEANAARRNAFNETRRAAREAGRALQLELTWWRISLVGWMLLWLTAVATITITGLRVIR